MLRLDQLTMRSRRSRLVGTALLLLLAFSASPACGTASQSATPLRVLAAASLTDAFTEIGEQFEAAHPGISVEFGFAASSTVVAQLRNGAPADLVATADTTSMNRLIDEGTVTDTPAIFATNSLAIIVTAGNPHAITGLVDLSRPGLDVVVAAPQVPLGSYTQDVLRSAGVSIAPASFETDAKAVVAKVARGEADGGIAYATDAGPAGRRVETVPVPSQFNVRASYPIAATSSGQQLEATALFIRFVTGPQGQAVLDRYGFGRP